MTSPCELGRARPGPRARAATVRAARPAHAVTLQLAMRKQAAHAPGADPAALRALEKREQLLREREEDKKLNAMKPKERKKYLQAAARLRALGVAKGQRVHSAIEYTHASGSIVPGSPGVVVRPGDAEDQLVVEFESGLLLNCRRGQVRTEAQQLAMQGQEGAVAGGAILPAAASAQPVGREILQAQAWVSLQLVSVSQLARGEPPVFAAPKHG